MFDSVVCGNTPENFSGNWTNKGFNCISDFCTDCGISECAGDLNSDGQVNGQDLGLLFVQWGSCGADCIADLTGNGQVDGEDLGLLFVAWGVCP